MTALLLASCGGKGKNSTSPTAAPKTTTASKPRNVISRTIHTTGDFTHILSMSGADIVFTPGDYSIEATGDSSLLQYLGIDIESSLLTLTLGSQANQDLNIYDSKPGITVHISAPSLQCVSLCSGGNFTSHGTWRSEKIEMGIIGSGSFQCDSIECASLRFQSSGSGSATFAHVKATEASFDNVATSNVRAAIDVDRLRASNTGRSTLSFTGRADMRDLLPSESGIISIKP